MKNPPIYIFSRHCFYSSVSSHKKRPSYFDRKLCFMNFLSTLEGDVFVTFFLDTYHQKDKPHFVQEQTKYPVITTKAGEEALCFLSLLEYVLSLRFEKEAIIYFVEDDYLHRPGFISVLKEGFSIPEVDYVTLYDHKDKYFYPEYSQLKSKLWITPSCHWRQTPSTTNTYAMKFATLQKQQEIHKKYSKGVSISKDHEKFLELQKQGACLISCIPGWATHVEIPYESPCIDWQKVLLKTAAF